MEIPFFRKRKGTLKPVGAEDDPSIAVFREVLDEKQNRVRKLEEEPERVDLLEGLKTLYKGHLDAVKCIACDISMDRVYSASWDGTLTCWSGFSREKVGVLPHANWVNSVSLLSIRVPADGRRQNEADSSTNSLFSKQGAMRNADSINGTVLATYAVCGDEDGYVTFWSTSELTVAHQLQPTYGAITCVECVSDMVFAASLHVVFVISAVTGTVVRELLDKVDAMCLAFGVENLYVGLDDGRIACWDIQDTFIARELIVPVNGKHDSQKEAASAIGAQSPSVQRHLKSCGAVRALVSQPAMNSLFAGYEDGHVRTWALSTGALLFDFAAHPKPIVCMTFFAITSSHGIILSGGRDAQVRATKVAKGNHPIINVTADGENTASLAASSVRGRKDIQTERNRLTKRNVTTRTTKSVSPAALSRNTGTDVSPRTSSSVPKRQQDERQSGGNTGEMRKHHAQHIEDNAMVDQYSPVMFGVMADCITVKHETVEGVGRGFRNSSVLCGNAQGELRKFGMKPVERFLSQ